MKVLVSACLLGRNCKYNGGNNLDPRVVAWLQDKKVIPVCPEVLAGLGVPRAPIELRDGVALHQDGTSADASLRAAVGEILQQAKAEAVDCAVLKSRSPTCGVHQIYDGTFSGTLTDGMGLLARALQEAGFQVIDCQEL